MLHISKIVRVACLLCVLDCSGGESSADSGATDPLCLPVPTDRQDSAELWVPGTRNDLVGNHFELCAGARCVITGAFETGDPRAPQQPFALREAGDVDGGTLPYRETPLFVIVRYVDPPSGVTLTASLITETGEVLARGSDVPVASTRSTGGVGPCAAQVTFFSAAVRLETLGEAQPDAGVSP